MKKLTLINLIAAMILAVVAGGCTKDGGGYDPEDYVTSVLTGDYEKDGMWKLYVTANGEPLEDYGRVRFDSKFLEEADFKFFDVIPGEASKEFRDIPLTETGDGYAFTIEYGQEDRPSVITGAVRPGKMTVDIKI